jgi:hypothetical protein
MVERLATEEVSASFTNQYMICIERDKPAYPRLHSVISLEDAYRAVSGTLKCRIA